MKKIAIAALVLASTAPAIAQETPLELWGGITYGMDYHRVKEIYPKGKVDLTAECRASVFGWSPPGKDNRIQYVMIEGTGYSPCGRIVRDGLREKYGDPIETSTMKRGDMMATETYQYQTDKLSIVMTLEVNNPNGAIPFGTYDVKYSPRSIAQNVAAKL